MLAFIVRRILSAIPLLFFLVFLTFFLLRLAPGGPFDEEKAWPPEVQANINQRYDLDKPVYVQFVRWVGDAVRGDLRESFRYTGRAISSIIAESLPTSIQLGFFSFLFSVFFGVLLGVLAAARPHSIWDYSSMFIAVAGVSLPTFLAASLFILVFSIGLGWLPPALWEGPSSMVLPVLALGTRPMAMIARLTRASMLESFHSDYVRTAYGKGLNEWRVIFKHVLRNSLIPVLTILGPIAGNLVTGSFVVEDIFQIPGMGRHFVQAVINRDYPLVMGVTLVYFVVLVVANLTVDLLYGWSDPRISRGSTDRRGVGRA